MNDLLSTTEGQNPVLSDAQILMQRQLMKFDIQINYLKEKFVRLREYLSPQVIFKGNDKQIDREVLDQLRPFILYYRNQIDTMKQTIQTNSHSNN